MALGFHFLAFSFLLALTPTQRWEAARRFDSNPMAKQWFIVTGTVAIIILTVLFFVISLRRKAQERKVAGQLFAEYAEKRGLSGREHQILLDIATKAGLRRSESIYTLSNAFDRGATKMIEESIARHGVDGSNMLRIELSFLREKLGFRRQYLSSTGSTTKLKELSSRQIPIGKKLHITHRINRNSGNIEAAVIGNNDRELWLKLTTPLESTPGEFWRVRYYFGASVWEFEASVVSSNGNTLVLNHSDKVRFINRRRFLRVVLNKPAFIARFPFTKTLVGDDDSGKAGSEAEQVPAGSEQVTSGCPWRPPEFVPAVVTELAGPGLRMEVPLEVEVGDRVLVVLRLNEEGAVSKIVEDIGEVRHAKAIQNGLSIAVELTGLNDSDVNELICATNAASLRAGTGGQDVQFPAGNKQGAEGKAQESAVVRGV